MDLFKYPSVIKLIFCILDLPYIVAPGTLKKKLGRYAAYVHKVMAKIYSSVIKIKMSYLLNCITNSEVADPIGYVVYQISLNFLIFHNLHNVALFDNIR